jgi:hypothetical protein
MGNVHGLNCIILHSGFPILIFSGPKHKVKYSLQKQPAGEHGYVGCHSNKPVKRIAHQAGAGETRSKPSANTVRFSALRALFWHL